MNVLRIRNELRNGRTIFDLPLRVTFYARVSTDKDEQINSLEKTQGGSIPSKQTNIKFRKLTLLRKGKVAKWRIYIW